MSLVSIVIPVYNVASYLDRCLSSCINQTLQDIEIIVVNDGSTDNSLSIINRYAEMDSRIVVVNKCNEGLLLARKSGIERVRCEFIFHLDGDDYLPEDALEILYKAATAKNADVVIGDYYMDQKGNIVSKTIPMDEELRGWSYLEKYPPTGNMAVWGKLIRRKLYDDFFYPTANICIGEDVYQILQLYSKAFRIVKANAYVYYYRERDGSIMRTADKKLVLKLYREFGKGLYELKRECEISELAFGNSLSHVIELLIYCCSLKDYRIVAAFLREYVYRNKRDRLLLFCYHPFTYRKMLCFRIAPLLYVFIRQGWRMKYLITKRAWFRLKNK